MSRTPVGIAFSPSINANNAINFSNGTSMYGKVLNYTLLNNLTDFTIEYWYNSNGTNTSKSLLYLRSDSTHYFRSSTDGAGSETLNCGVSYSSQETYYGRISGWGANGSWTHLAITHNSASKSLAGFSNGVPLGASFSQSGSVTQNLVTGADLYLATDYALGSFIKGKFACLRMWNSVRTAAQLLANKDYYLDPTQESGIVLNLNIIEGSGTTITNSAIGGNNMSLLNTPTWTTGPALTAKTYNGPRSAAGTRTVAGTRTLAT